MQTTLIAIQQRENNCVCNIKAVMLPPRKAIVNYCIYRLQGILPRLIIFTSINMIYMLEGNLF